MITAHKVLVFLYLERSNEAICLALDRPLDWAFLLAFKFKQGEGTGYIDAAIVLDRKALESCPLGHPERPVSLTCLAIHLNDRYDHCGAMGDLEEAIVVDQEALELRQKGHPDRSTSLNNLGVRLYSRYKRLGIMEDLNRAIVLDREALHLRPKGNPDRSMSLNNMAVRLSTRFSKLGVIEDLHEAIILDRESLELRPQGHLDRWMSSNNLATHLFARYNQLGAMADLDEAVLLDREALRLLPKGCTDRPSSLSNLAAHLSTRYNQLGGIQDLEEAVSCGQEALDHRPQGHPYRSVSLNVLASLFFTRYRQHGIIEDLSKAIILGREELALRAQGHPDRRSSLNNLSVRLSTRYDLLSVMEDLQEAIVLGQEAMDLLPKEHPDRSMSLNNLARHFCSRYKQLGAIEDLNVAIALEREALEFRPKGHPDRSMSLNNLGVDLCIRFKQLKIIEDLDEAIVLHREALHFRPQGHPDRSMSLTNLAHALCRRYNQLWVVEDIDEAILIGQEALDLRPEGHHDRSTSLNNLANYLLDRFSLSKQPEDEERLFNIYCQLVDVTHIASSSDLFATRTWINVAEALRHPTTLLAYETTLRLLVQHLATLPSLPRHLSTFKNFASTTSLDAFSACLRNNSPTKAVELLEQGRAVFWSQLSRLRSPLDDIITSGAAGKELADEFTRLSSLIRYFLDSAAENQHEQLCHLNLEVQRVVTKIRELPGLSRFLLPSLFSDLQHAANEGPVIIVNASKFSCDALVVLRGRDPVHIPLQITQKSVHGLSMELHALSVRAMRVDMKKALAAFLRKLWDQIVSPIVDFLQTIYPPRSRIWWCPTGEFSVLPLHAAGPFRKGQQNLPNIYVSSYTPTLTALIHARWGHPSGSATGQKCLVAIGQAKASGEAELVSVGSELDNVRRLVGDLATFTCIDGEDACASKVIEALGKNEWVHFACHGIPNRTQPFESAFALHDGRFTIQRLIGCDLKNPEFAYLSACHTTVGDEESPDEVIHLASAMQFVGFRSVIGTMWAVDDGETNKITSAFYKHMVDESGRLDHTRAALALNRTMKSVKVPLDQQILYIHLGA